MNALADCLIYTDKQIDTTKTEFGPLEVEWAAKLENQCSAALDANLNVRFLDESGESVYEIFHLTRMRPGESRNTGKTVYVPRRYASDISDFEITAAKSETGAEAITEADTTEEPE